MKIILHSLAAVAIMLAANMARTPLYSALSVDKDNPWAFGASFVITLLLVVLAIALLTRGQFNWQLRRTGGIVGGIVGGTAVVAVPMILGWFFLSSAEGLPEDVPQGGITAGVLFFIFCRSYLLQGIPEELLFRGWLFELTKSRPVFTVVWTTVAFTLPHLISLGGQDGFVEHLLYLALPLGMGVIGGAVRVASGSFWWAAGTHGGMHLCMAVLTGFWPKELGPESWLVLGGAQLVAGVLILVWVVRVRRSHPRAASH